MSASSNTIFRAVTLCDHTLLGPEDLELAGSTGAAERGEGGASEGTSLADAVAAFERDLLQRLYPTYPSSRKLAARLGTSHTMIAAKLRRYGLPEAGPGRSGTYDARLKRPPAAR